MQDKRQIKKFPPITPKVPHIIHGGDYNPDQWLSMPEILQEDVRLMKLAGINSASVAIFAWKALEPEEGIYHFEWLDQTLDRLHQNGISVILATPSGARPAWMDHKYPEVLRVNADRTKNLHGERHNHCYTSPYYRKKVFEMNRLLAERYHNHPAVTMWHLSNEYGGECHCEHCQRAFREWLKVKYDNDIQKLNHEWWTYFWSHSYSNFDEIESPSPLGEQNTHGLNLDWMRFVTYQTTEFMKNEIAAVKQVDPSLPVVTNLMGTYPGLDPWKMVDVLDVVSWDNYPEWHNLDKPETVASSVSFVHDLNRSLKKKPFMMMESTPSIVNWKPINKLKRPGMHILSSIQAIAHGSDTVQYFQWRKGRGASEKFHGAVVGHCGHEHTRVFKEVAQLGKILKQLDGIVGTTVKPQAAIIYDWENKWAIDDLKGWSTSDKNYEETCKQHYHAFWKRGIPTDVINMDCDFKEYQMISAPMLYLLKPTVADRLKAFVKQGGTLILTYCTGHVNQNDLCFLGGFPGDGLQELTGIWAEEMDTLYPTETRKFHYQNNSLTLTGAATAHTFCELIHPKEHCEVLAVYDEDFYQDMPVITKNLYGNGNCYYLAARTDFETLNAFYGKLIEQANLEVPSKQILPTGVTIQQRYGDGENYWFVLNFTNAEQTITLNEQNTYFDIISNQKTSATITLHSYGFAILKTESVSSLTFIKK